MSRLKDFLKEALTIKNHVRADRIRRRLVLVSFAVSAGFSLVHSDKDHGWMAAADCLIYLVFAWLACIEWADLANEKKSDGAFRIPCAAEGCKKSFKTAVELPLGIQLPDGWSLTLSLPVVRCPDCSQELARAGKKYLVEDAH